MKCIILIISLLIVAGCTADNDQYDKLKVVDGNGRVLIIKHNIFETYFITEETPQVKTKNSEINAKLIIPIR